MDNFAMHRAAEVGDLEKIEHLVSEGMSLATLDDYKYTALHFAAKCGHFEVTEFLISQMIDLDLMSEEGSTAVMVAAEFGHKNIVELLLRSGASVEGCSEIGKWTLLHYACRLGWTDIVKYLVEQETDKKKLDVETTLEMTPLLLAASEGHADIVEILLKAGASIGCLDINLWNVLHYASKKGWLHVVQQIVEIERSLVNSVTNKKKTALLLAAKEGHKEVVEFLIDAGADIFCRGEARLWTVLHYACKWNWLEIVKKIVQIKPQYSHINAIIYDNGITPLHIAGGMRHTEIVKELLKAGADAGITNDHDKNAIVGKDMHDAASIGDVERVQHLLKLGVPVDTRDEWGFTPLHRAAESNQLAMGKFLIHNNCDVNLKNEDDETPIFFAVRNEREKFVDLLVKSGADVSCCPEGFNKTILHIACSYGWKDTVQYILQNGGVKYVEAKTTRGITPLMFAVDHVDCEVARLLLKAGANVNACDDRGDTALHYASTEYGNADTVKMLLSAGADANHENRDKETALHHAVEHEIPEVIKVLVQHGAYFTHYKDDEISKSIPLKQLVLTDVDLCVRLIKNKFNHQSLPVVYKNPEYAKRLPRIDRLHIGNSIGIDEGIESCVKSEIETKTFCNVTKIRPTVLTLMCVEALINPQPTSPVKRLTKKKKSAKLLYMSRGLVKRSKLTFSQVGWPSFT